MNQSHRWSMCWELLQMNTLHVMLIEQLTHMFNNTYLPTIIPTYLIVRIYMMHMKMSDVFVFFLYNHLNVNCLHTTISWPKQHCFGRMRAVCIPSIIQTPLVTADSSGVQIVRIN